MLYVDDLLFEVFLCVLRCYHVPERFDQVLRYRPALRPLGTTAAAKARRAQGTRTPTSPHERYVPRRTNSSILQLAEVKRLITRVIPTFSTPSHVGAAGKKAVLFS